MAWNPHVDLSEFFDHSSRLPLIARRFGSTAEVHCPAPAKLLPLLLAGLLAGACSGGQRPPPSVPSQQDAEQPSADPYDRPNAYADMPIWEPGTPSAAERRAATYAESESAPATDGGIDGPIEPAPGVVHAVENHLERDGSPYVLRGVNGPAPWGARYKKIYNKPLAALRLDGVSKMAALGANAMRIVHFIAPDGRLPAEIELEQTVKEVLRQDMVPILGIWDRTCKTSPAEHVEDFWLQGQGASLAHVYPQLVINPYNELNFEDGQKRTNHRAWADYYIEFVERLRAAGHENLIMIDSGGKCAQNPRGILEFGQEIVDADPLHNIVFSVHLYAYWKTEGRLANWPEGQFRLQEWIKKFRDAPFPVVFGEFGGPNPKINADYDVKVAMGTCQDGMDGRLFWMDFDSDNKTFYNVYTDLTWSKLTPVGKQVAKWLRTPCNPPAQP